MITLRRQHYSFANGWLKTAESTGETVHVLTSSGLVVAIVLMALSRR